MNFASINFCELPESNIWLI